MLIEHYKQIYVLISKINNKQFMLTYKRVDIMVQPITNLLRKFALSPPQKKKKNQEPFENIKINKTDCI